MAIVLKAAAAALAAITVVGVGVGVGGAASAAELTRSAHTDTVNSAKAQWSRGFDFHNTATVPMIFTDQSWPTGIPLGTVVLPGQSLHFEVPYDGGMMENSYLEFTPKAGYGASGKIQFTLTIEGVANTNSTWTGEDGMSGFDGITDDRNLYVVDPAGTDITLDGSTNAQAQQEATALHQLCDDSILATCQFDVKTEDPTARGPAHQVGISVVNHQDNPVVFKKLESDNVGVSDSVGVSVSAGGQLFGLINIAVNASYQHNINSSSTYTNEVDTSVDPGDTVWVLDTAPVIRDTGNFTITMGNTTYHLNHVSFDSPDANRQGQWQICSLLSKVQCSVRPDGTADEL